MHCWPILGVLPPRTLVAQYTQSGYSRNRGVEGGPAASSSQKNLAHAKVTFWQAFVSKSGNYVRLAGKWPLTTSVFLLPIFQPRLQIYHTCVLATSGQSLWLSLLTLVSKSLLTWHFMTHYWVISVCTHAVQPSCSPHPPQEEIPELSLHFFFFFFF